MVWGYVHKDITPLYLNVKVHVLALIVPVLFIVALVNPVIRYAKCAVWPMWSFVQVSILTLRKTWLRYEERRAGDFAAGHP